MNKNKIIHILILLFCINIYNVAGKPEFQDSGKKNSCEDPLLNVWGGGGKGFLYFKKNVVSTQDPISEFHGEYEWKTIGKDSLYIYFDYNLFKARYYLHNDSLFIDGNMAGKRYLWNLTISSDSEKIKILEKEGTPQDKTQKEQIKGVWITVNASDFAPVADLVIRDGVISLIDRCSAYLEICCQYQLKNDSIMFKANPDISEPDEKNSKFEGTFSVKNDTLTVIGKYNGSSDYLYEISGKYQRMENYDKKIRLKYKTSDNHDKMNNEESGR